MNDATVGAQVPDDANLDAIARVAQAGDYRKPSDKQMVRITPQHDGSIRVEVTGHEALVFRPRQASLLNRSMAEFHGWKARLMERAAVDASTTTGKTDPAAKYATLAKTIAHYESGTEAWELGAGAAKDKEPTLGLLMRAMVALGKLADAGDVDAFNRKLDENAAKLGVDRDHVVKQLKANALIKAKIDELRAQDRAKTLANADEILDGWA